MTRTVDHDRLRHTVDRDRQACSGVDQGRGSEAVRKLSCRGGTCAQTESGRRGVAQGRGRDPGDCGGRLGCRIDVVPAGETAQESAGDAVRRILDEGVLGSSRRPDDGVEIEAQLLDDRAVHLDDLDLEHHLITAGDGDQADHLLGVAHEGGSQAHRLVDLRGVGRLAREHQAVVGRLDVDGGAGQQARQGVGHRARVLVDADVEPQDLAAHPVHEGGVRAARARAHDVDAPGGGEGHVRDPGVGHHHVARVHRQLDHRRFAAGQGQLAHRARPHAHPHHAAARLLGGGNGRRGAHGGEGVGPAAAREGRGRAGQGGLGGAGAGGGAQQQGGDQGAGRGSAGRAGGDHRGTFTSTAWPLRNTCTTPSETSGGRAAICAAPPASA